jgi:hypothetical protein
MTNELSRVCHWLADHAAALVTADWAKVTCRECRLEQPLAEPQRAPEYRVPQHRVAPCSSVQAPCRLCHPATCIRPTLGGRTYTEARRTVEGREKRPVDIWMRKEEDEGMSDELIHFRDGLSWKTKCGRLPQEVWTSVSLAERWPDVTCPDCRLEQPLAEPQRAPEYRVPKHVLAMDRSLTLADQGVWRRHLESELAVAEQDYTDAMNRAAEAARSAHLASKAAARIRTLLAEQEPAWRAMGVGASGGVQSFSGGYGSRLSKPGPY